MFRDPKYFQQFECPYSKANKKCEQINCIFSHPKKDQCDVSTKFDSNTLGSSSKINPISTDGPLPQLKDIEPSEIICPSKILKKENTTEKSKAEPEKVKELNVSKKVFPKEKHHKVQAFQSVNENKTNEDNRSLPDLSNSKESVDQTKKRKSIDQIKEITKKQNKDVPIQDDKVPVEENNYKKITPPSAIPKASDRILKEFEQPIKPITHIDVCNEERLANVESFLPFLNQNKQLALNKEFKIIQSCKSKEEYQVRVKNLISPQDAKFISPRPVVPNSPAPLQDRKRFIEHIVTILLKVNPRLRTPKKKAMQIEYEVAQSASSSTYGTLIRQRIHKLSHPEKYKPKPKGPTKEEQLEILRKWSISEDKLRKFGFVMDIPEATELPMSRKCCRCGTQFLVSEQLQSVECRFHSGKIRRKTDRSRYHECCMAEENQSPCSSSNHHVYLLDSIQEKQQTIPYKFTRDIFQTPRTEYPVLGIDCEMGFTTKGFELMRITAVDYFTNDTVLDVYVLPFGEVVDFNTRFSGISEINDDFISFEESINKLGEVMYMNTILIGHGLENDMNAMRLIHDKIIDTSILYPKFQPSPTFRWSLKDLAFKFLSRNIQIGEHDSTEDSIAAIDIVKHFVNKELAR